MNKLRTLLVDLCPKDGPNHIQLVLCPSCELNEMFRHQVGKVQGQLTQYPPVTSWSYSNTGSGSAITYYPNTSNSNHTFTVTSPMLMTNSTTFNISDITIS